MKLEPSDTEVAVVMDSGPRAARSAGMTWTVLAYPDCGGSPRDTLSPCQRSGTPYMAPPRLGGPHTGAAHDDFRLLLHLPHDLLGHRRRHRLHRRALLSGFGQPGDGRDL